MTKPIRSPHDIPHQPLNDLVEQWSAARMRTIMASHNHDQHARPDANDLFIELTYGVRIAQEATASRWCVVAALLRSGVVDSWSHLGTLMGVTESEARDGFQAWIAGQVDLHRRTGACGITAAEADDLYALSEAVAW